MLIEQIIEFKLKGAGAPGHTCTPTTGNFYEKTKVSTENFRVEYHLQLKYSRRHCILLPSIYLGQITYNILLQKCKILNAVLDLKCK